MKIRKWLFPAAAVISLLSVLAIQLVFLPWKLNSDSAFAPIFAAWQVKTGQFFPDGMCYSTGIMGISSNLFMIPGYLLFGGNLLAARISGIFLMLLLLYLLLYLVFQTGEKRDFVTPSIAGLLFTIPFLGSAATEQYLVEGAYLNQVLWILVGFLAFRAFARTTGVDVPGRNRPIPKKKETLLRLLFGFLIVLIIVAADLHAYRNLLTAFLPLTATFLFWIVWKQGDALDLKRTARKWLPLAAVALLGAALGVFVYLRLSRLYWPTENQTQLVLGNGLGFSNRFHTLANALISIAGNANAAPLLSLRGIGKLLGYGVALLLYLVLPLYSIKNFKRFHRDLTRFLIAFAFIGSAFTVLIVLAADLTGVGNDLSRYCLPIYANCLLLAAAVLGDLLCGLSWTEVKADRPAGKEKADVRTDRPAGKEKADGRTDRPAGAEKADGRTDRPAGAARVILRLVPSFLAISALLFHGIYWKVTWDEHFLLPNPYTMTGFLLENDLHEGYASYWYAHRFTALTNFDLTIADIRVEGGFIRPDYWLTNKAYYEKDFGKDRCFLMLTEDELQGFAPEGVENTALGAPSETLRYNQFYILVYDENIGSENRLNWTDGIGYR